MKRNSILDSIRTTISPDVKREIDLSFEIADRIYEILKKQSKTQRDLAATLGKKESEVSKWLRGTHNFTTQTIARIECALGEPIVEVTGTAKKVEKEYIVVHMSYPQSVTIPAEQYNHIDIPVGKNWVNTPYNKAHKDYN